MACGLPLSRAAFVRLGGLAAAGALLGRAPRAVEAAELPTVRLMLATDLHLLAPELVAAGELPAPSTISSGAMLTAHTDAILDALLATALEERPDALVLTGDIAFAGESESHAHVAARLGAAATAGLRVLVVPGNHDVDGDTGQAAFARVYGQFGPADALSCDDASFSYVVEVASGLRLLFVDANTDAGSGMVPEATLAWIAEQLADAGDAGARVLAFSHQLLVGGGSYDVLLMDRAAELRELYGRHRLAVNFSGHLHGSSVQTADDGLVDVTTAALSIWPLRYGLVEVEPGASAPSFAGATLRYLPAELDMESWARDSGASDPDLLDFASYARAFTYDAQYASMCAMLEGLGASADDAAELAAYFADLSCAVAENGPQAVESRPDLLERFLRIADGSTATRFAYAFDPATAAYAPQALELTLP